MYPTHRYKSFSGRSYQYRAKLEWIWEELEHTHDSLARQAPSLFTAVRSMWPRPCSQTAIYSHYWHCCPPLLLLSPCCPPEAERERVRREAVGSTVRVDLQQRWKKALSCHVLHSGISTFSAQPLAELEMCLSQAVINLQKCVFRSITVDKKTLSLLHYISFCSPKSRTHSSLLRSLKYMVCTNIDLQFPYIFIDSI